MTNTVFTHWAHGDDETLTGGLPTVHWAAAGWDHHVVTYSHGDVSAASLKLDGLNGPCGHPSHLYTHSPAAEGYAVPTPAEIGEARMRETANAIAAATLITPNAGVARVGRVFHHVHTLPTGFGGPSGGAPTQAGIDAVAEIMQPYLDAYPDAAHHAQSYTDDHPDHAAIGYALKTFSLDPDYSADLADSMWFVSRLYWATTLGAYPADVYAQGPQWFPTNVRKPEYDAVVRKMRDAFYAYSPTDGLFAIGAHQVPSQFARAVPAAGSGQNIAAIWHSRH